MGSRSGDGLQRACVVSLGLRHWPIVHFDNPGAVEAVERGAQTGAVGTQLAGFDPVALGHVGRQQERAAHHVGAVAGGPEQGEAGRFGGGFSLDGLVGESFQLAGANPFAAMYS